ncbi:flagellar basal body P-ring formation chaperone FlgA [Natronospora cellulosivora (SeqCode)]
MKTKLIRILFITVILTLAISNFIKAEQININIPAEVEVSSSPVTLGDIAQIHTSREEDRSKIASIELIRILLPGYSRHVQKSQINLILNNSNFEPELIDLSMANVVKVTRSKRLLDTNYLIDEARQFLLSLIEYDPEKVEITPRFMPPEIVLADSDYELEFELASNRVLGNISLQVKVIVDGFLYRQFYMGLQVKIYEEVFIARREISVGERIKQEDFHKVYKALSDFRGDIIRDLDNTLVRNGIVTRRISRDGVLTTYHLALPIIVSPSDVLQAEIISGGIRVRTQVIARQSGRKGDYITVENINNKHRFRAEIINSNLVRLVFNEEG